MGQKNAKLSQDDIKLLSENTKFDKKELQLWYKGFTHDCPSGILNRTDFIKIYRSFFPFGDAKPFAELVFRMFDTDRNDEINFKEFIIALSIASKGTQEEKINWAFQMYDMDNDGFISRAEMEHAVDAIYKMMGNLANIPESQDTPAKRVTTLFQWMDTNKDDRISLEEFREGVRQDPSIIQTLSMFDGLS
eukprot:GCRY01000758.1.p1 GENE.GCRY01000758.1~~GCRY01000758.1.p1  ORF type:complete len:191 (+),score=30.05 GCRY01000758.1:233-805(+)